MKRKSTFNWIYSFSTAPNRNKPYSPIHERFVFLFRILASGELCLVRKSRRVLQVEVVVQPEVNEAEHSGVELHKDRHQLDVDALGWIIGELRNVSSSLSLSRESYLIKRVECNLGAAKIGFCFSINDRVAEYPP